MRVLIERNELMRALGHVTSVVERRTTVPILSNVLLRAIGSSLELKATDLEREVVETVAAEVTQPGAVTVPAHMLNDIVRKLPDGCDIEIVREAERERLTIRAGQSRFALQTIAADVFPDFAAGKLTHTFEVPAADLKALIKKTRFAISTEETRYYLTGIYLHTAERNGHPTLRAVATDGHRLAQLDIDRPKGAEGMAGVIVPKKTVDELHRLIETTEATITIGVSASKVRFEIGPITLVSILIDGSFPDYQRVIPQGNDKLMKVLTADFMSAVDRVSTIASERGRGIKLAIAPEKLTLSVTSPDGGSATDELVIDYGHNSFKIGFNARYLMDVSGQMKSDTMHFLLADSGSPIIVKDGDDDRALYVLMPMRV
jgi:DNA polymerase-3 subunit beta